MPKIRVDKSLPKIDQVSKCVQGVVAHYGADVTTFRGVLSVAAAMLTMLPDEMFEDGIANAQADLREMAEEIRRQARPH
jgi:hypothetical protein